MDRRTLLAMVLLLGLFLVWTKAMERYHPKTPPAAVADSLATTATDTAVAERAAATKTPARTTPAPTTAPAPQSAAPADSTAGVFPAPGDAVYTVDTDLYTATISERGGEITSWKLHDFVGPDGGDVELVPTLGDLDQQPAGDVIVFENGELDLTDAPFTPLGPSELRLGAGDGPRDLTLAATTLSGTTVRKILTFHPGSYRVDLRYEVGDAPGVPRSLRVEWTRGIAETEHAVHAMMRRSMSYRAFAQVGDQFHAVSRRNLGKEKGEVTYRGSVRFAGLQNKYFTILAWLPGAAENAVEGRIRLGGDAETQNQSWELEVPVRTDRPGDATSVSLYLGPSDYRRLRALDHGLEKTVNLGWKWIQPISELVLRLMNWLHGFIPNYGWVIIIISVLSKLVFWPLTARGTRAMKKMQESQARLKPKLDALKKKYGDDQQRYNQEMMKLYKEEGVNPLAGMGGCLPMLVQMPVFFALYQVLYNMVDLRLAPWIFWIKDLSQPDALFTMPFSLPLIGNLFNLLPIIMAIVTWWQTKLTPKTGAGDQMAAMNAIMPVMMLFFLYNMPSGLVIYWTINTGVTALQTWQVHRSAPATGGAPA